MVENEFLSLAVAMISVFSWFCMYRLAKIANGGSFFYPSLSNWFLWWLIVFALIGPTYLMLHRDSYEEAVGLYQYPDAVLAMWIMANLAAFLIPLGMIIANKYWDINAHRLWRSFIDTNIDTEYLAKSKSFKVTFVAVMIVSLFVIAYYYSQIDIPILSVMSGVEANELALLRSDATNNFAGKYYRYRFFMAQVVPILLFVSYFLRKYFFYKTIFVFLLFVRIFTCIANLEKASIVDFIFIFLFARFYEKRQINKKYLAIVAGGIVATIILMYVFFMGADTSNSEMQLLLVEGILRRVFVGQIVGTAWYYEYVEKYGLLLGATLPNPAGIFPFEHHRITVEVMEMVFPDLVRLGIVGSMPTAFWGDGYINWGYSGAIMCMLAWGIILRTIDIYLQGKYAGSGKVLILVAYIFFVGFMKRYTGTSILGLWTDVDFWGSILLFLIIEKSACVVLYKIK